MKKISHPFSKPVCYCVFMDLILLKNKFWNVVKKKKKKEMGLGRATLIQMLLSLLKFSRFSQGNMPLFVSTLLLISTVLKVLTLTVCCQCFPCFYEEKHFCSPSAILGSPTPPFHCFFPVEFTMFFITKNTDFPKWIG